MNSSYVGFLLSFSLGGIIVWIFLRAIFAKTRVPRTEFDELNSNYRDSIVENVKLEERISIMQERVEELNEKLLKAQHELSIATDAKNSVKSKNEMPEQQLNAQESEIENISQKFEEK